MAVINLALLAAGYGSLKRGQAEQARRLDRIEAAVDGHGSEPRFMSRQDSLRMHGENRTQMQRIEDKLDRMILHYDQNDGGE